MKKGTILDSTRTSLHQNFRLELQARLRESHFHEDEVAIFMDLFCVLKTFKKGSLLLSEGEYPTVSYQIAKGCIRQYQIKKGEEKTTFFYEEHEAVTLAFHQPSFYYLECTEDTSVFIFTEATFEALYQKIPRLKSLCLKSTEQQLNDYHRLLSIFITSSPKERYLHLLETRPSLFHRVPQHQIASFLGIKPESLSRIRKRLATRQKAVQV